MSKIKNNIFSVMFLSGILLITCESINYSDNFNSENELDTEVKAGLNGNMRKKSSVQLTDKSNLERNSPFEVKSRIMLCFDTDTRDFSVQWNNFRNAFPNGIYDLCYCISI